MPSGQKKDGQQQDNVIPIRPSLPSPPPPSRPRLLARLTARTTRSRLAACEAELAAMQRCLLAAVEHAGYRMPS
jgi:hypothetical protein